MGKKKPAIESTKNLGKAVNRAVSVIRSGGLVVYPTDTSYGLGCDPTQDKAMDKLVAAKKRDPSMGVPLLFADLAQCETYHDFGELERVLVKLFWPGALTLVVTARHPVLAKVSGKRDSIAVRVPNHPVPRTITRELGGPIVGTSANISGGQSPFDVNTAIEQLGDSVDLYVDDGPSKSTANSTIIGVEPGAPSNIRVYREGELTVERLSEVLKVDAKALGLWSKRIVYADR
ncbi:MAG: threonylcarbamoyl-AMP synthase [Candidatus Thorarchaeota archaeon]|nr:MAG: threonylcarbamoyl-AMP synthase [Candidatus Thorarchaeota archaeon]